MSFKDVFGFKWMMSPQSGGGMAPSAPADSTTDAMANMLNWQTGMQPNLGQALSAVDNPNVGLKATVTNPSGASTTVASPPGTTLAQPKVGRQEITPSRGPVTAPPSQGTQDWNKMNDVEKYLWAKKQKNDAGGWLSNMLNYSQGYGPQIANMLAMFAGGLEKGTGNWAEGLSGAVQQMYQNQKYSEMLSNMLAGGGQGNF
jgi:hypothetical protein